MAKESERQDTVSERVGKAVKDFITPRPNYLGGELQAAFRQGFNELGTAFGKAMPDSLQIDEPGQAFNPLYRDMDGKPKDSAEKPDLPTPSQIVKAAGGIHGEAKQPSRDLPSPSEILKEQPQQNPEQDQGRQQGQERGGRGM